MDKQWIEIDNQPQFRTIGSIVPGHNGVSASRGSNGKIYLEICQYTSGTPYVVSVALTDDEVTALVHQLVAANAPS